MGRSTKLDELACRKLLDWIAIIDAAATGNDGERGDWRAAAWLLERLHPEEFGKSVKAAVTEEIQSFLAELKDRLDARTWREIVRVAGEPNGSGGHSRSRAS